MLYKLQKYVVDEDETQVPDDDDDNKTKYHHPGYGTAPYAGYQPWWIHQHCMGLARNFTHIASVHQLLNGTSN